MSMQFINAEQIHRLLDYPSLVAALEQAHQRPVNGMQDLWLEQPNPTGLSNHLLIRAAWRHGQAFGAKLVSVFPGNVHTPNGHPSVQGVYILFDGDNGQPAACLDGTALTVWKTAADSALGAKFLAREEVECMLMVGAGAMAPHLIRAHLAIRPSIHTVRIWNRTPARAEKLAQSLAHLPIKISAIRDLEQAVGEADLISCATMTTTPLIRGAWLKPGAHLDLVGAYTPAMREADDEAIRRARIFVDSRLTTIGHIGELLIPLSKGVIQETDILADLFDLCQKKHPGRQSADEITLFKNGGGGHLDLMTAQAIQQRSNPHDA
jgi:ornithine cyclodeaminase